MKRTLLITLIIILVTIFISLPVMAEKKITVQSPPIPAAIPLLWMEEEGLLPASVEFSVRLSSDHQRGISLLAKNDIDLLVTGANVGAKIYNKGIGAKLLNVNTWGIDYLLTYGFKAEKWSDLRGKSLGVLLQGGPLDFLARYLMQQNGVNPEEVKLVYRPLPGVAKYFLTGNLDAIILPEPLVTVNLSNSEKIHLSMDIQQEWKKIHGDARIPFVGLFVSSKFAKNNPEFTSIVNGFYQQGIAWANENPDKAAQLAAKHFGMPAGVIEKSLKRVNLNIYSQTETRRLVDLYFSKILKIYPEMIGGKMPDEAFYY